LMLFALTLPSASRVPVTVMVSLSWRSEAWPTTVLRTMTVWSNVTLTSMLQRASWTVRLLPVRLVTVPVAPRRAAAPLALDDGDEGGDGKLDQCTTSLGFTHSATPRWGGGAPPGSRDRDRRTTRCRPRCRRP